MRKISPGWYLPGVPAACDLVDNGLDLGKMDATLMQKVEELTLYVLQLKQENEKQEQKINELIAQLRWNKK